ncbi:hypothetical protein SP90_12825 [Halodesulfovibrio spirochaetisodalis]|uniref:Uncharacterized protein n=1 Tax=Halodesulfovibrio spirochaetisodalis TaxID=1560234 RepID=A0A1B7XAN9_9BACT|nr:hypothetical protein SP90_12825 [Halodesulfovibrio spirochaetisodalis]
MLLLSEGSKKLPLKRDKSKTVTAVMEFQMLPITIGNQSRRLEGFRMKDMEHDLLQLNRMYALTWRSKIML